MTKKKKRLIANSQKGGIRCRRECPLKCLDTDLLIAILRGNEDACNQVMDLNENTKGATTAINAFEVFYGSYRSERKTENTNEVIKLLEKLYVIPLDLASSKRTAELLAKLAEKEQMVDYRDAMIAGVALENDLTLVTRNTLHFKRINGLKLEKW